MAVALVAGAAQAQTRESGVVAESGDLAPPQVGTTPTDAFEEFYIPTLSDDGTISFVAKTGGGAFDPELNIFRVTPQGDIFALIHPELTPNMLFGNERDPLSGDLRSSLISAGSNGDITAIIAAASSTDAQVIRLDNGTPTVIAGFGTPAPGTDGLTFLGGFGREGLFTGDGDTTVFGAILDDFTQGIFRYQNGALSQIDIDLTALGANARIVEQSVQGANKSGDIVFTGQVLGADVLPQQSGVVGIVANGVTTVLASGNTQAEGFNDASLLFTGAMDAQINASRQVVLGMDVRSTTGDLFYTNNEIDGLYAASAAEGLTLITRRGASAAGLVDGIGFNVTEISSPLIADSGEIAFFAAAANAGNTASGESLLRYDIANDTIAQVAQTGFTFFGNYELSGFDTLAMNDNGALAFTGLVEHQPEDVIESEFALVAERNDQLQLIATTGSLVSLDIGDQREVSNIFFVGGSTSNGQATGFNNFGQLAYVLDFFDGSSALFYDDAVQQMVDRYVWSGDCGSDRWNDLSCAASNWDNGATGEDAGQAPGTGDNDMVLINNADVRLVDGNFTSIYSITATGSLLLEALLEIDGPSSIESLALNVVPQEIGMGFAPLGLEINNVLLLQGSSTWLNGVISGSGQLDVAGDLLASPAAGSGLYVPLNVRDGGTLRVDGDLTGPESGFGQNIHVLDGGLLEVVSGSLTRIPVTLEGKLEKSGDGFFEFGVNTPFVSDGGTLNVRSGTLALPNNGTTLSGTIGVAEGAELLLEGFQTFVYEVGTDTNKELVIEGLAGGHGRVTANDADMRFAADTTLFVELGGSEGGLFLTGNSKILEGGTVIVRNGGRLAFASDSGTQILSPINVRDGGTVLQQDSGAIFATGSILSISEGGTYQLEGPSGLIGDADSGNIDIFNGGTILKTGNGTASISGFSLDQGNAGKIRTEEGTLELFFRSGLTGTVETLAGATTTTRGDIFVPGRDADATTLIVEGEGQFLVENSIIQPREDAAITIRNSGTTGGFVFGEGNSVLGDPGSRTIYSIDIEETGRLATDFGANGAFTFDVEMILDVVGLQEHLSGELTIASDYYGAGQFNVLGGHAVFEPSLAPFGQIFDDMDFRIAAGAVLEFGPGVHGFLESVVIAGDGTLMLDPDATLDLGSPPIDGGTLSDNGRIVNTLTTPFVLAGTELRGGEPSGNAAEFTNLANVQVSHGSWKSIDFFNGSKIEIQPGGGGLGLGGRGGRLIAPAEGNLVFEAAGNETIEFDDVNIVNVDGLVSIKTDTHIAASGTLEILNLDRFEIEGVQLGTINSPTSTIFENGEDGVLALNSGKLVGTLSGVGELISNGNSSQRGALAYAGDFTVESGLFELRPGSGDRTDTIENSTISVSADAAFAVARNSLTILGRTVLEGGGDVFFNGSGGVFTLQIGDGEPTIEPDRLINRLDSELQISSNLKGFSSLLPGASSMLVNEGEMLLEGNVYDGIVLVNGASGEGGAEGTLTIAPQRNFDRGPLEVASSQLRNFNGTVTIQNTEIFTSDAVSLEVFNGDRMVISNSELIVRSDALGFRHAEGAVLEFSGNNRIEGSTLFDGLVKLQPGSDVKINAALGSGQIGLATIASGQWIVDRAALTFELFDNSDAQFVRIRQSDTEVTLIGPEASINAAGSSLGALSFSLDRGRLNLVDHAFVHVGSVDSNTAYFGSSIGGIPPGADSIAIGGSEIGFFNTGRLDCQGNSSVTIDEGTLFWNARGGVITGSCVINGDLYNEDKPSDIATKLGALLAPGNSPGIMEITGDFTNASGGILEIEIGGTTPGTEHDQLIVGGTTTLLEGSQIQISFIDPDPTDGDNSVFRPQQGDVINFLVTNGLELPDGGELADYISLADDGSGFRPAFKTVEVNGLTLLQLSVLLGIPQSVLAGLMGQQAIAGTYVNNLLLGDGLPGGTTRAALEAIADLDPAFIPAALAELHPEAYATGPFVMARRQALHLADAAMQADRLMQRSGKLGLWVSIGTGNGELEPRSGFDRSEIDTDTFGIVGGIDLMLGRGLRVGGFIGHTDSDQKFSSLAALNESNAIGFGGYLRVDSGPLSATILGARVEGDASTERVLATAASGAKTESDYNLDSWILRGHVEYDLKLGKLAVKPTASLTWIDTKRGAVQETGGDGLALSVDGLSDEALILDLGLELATRVGKGPLAARPYLSAGWRHDFEAGGELATARFAGTSSSMTALGALPVENSARVSAGIDLPIGPNLLLAARYDGEMAKRQSAHSGSVSVSLTF